MGSILYSTDEPPSNNSMFQRAGGESSSKNTLAQGESVVQAFASAIVHLLLPVLQSLHLHLLIQVPVAQQN